MKVKVIGNGFSWLTRPNTSFLIDDETLLDVPQSCTKFMFGKVDFSKIKHIFITHFHSDHFADLHLFYDIFKRLDLPYRVKVVAPKTALKHLVMLCKALDLKRDKKKILKIFEFVELKPGAKIELDEYEIETFKTEHNVSHSLAYAIKRKGDEKTIGFTGDSILCQGVLDLIERSDVIFIDTTAVHNKHKSHMNVDEVLSLQKKFFGKEFHSIHVPDFSVENLKEELHIPDCMEVLNFK